MIRKNPRGDLPQIHESAYVDQTAIICGKVIIEENVFVGRVTAQATEFSEDVVRTNHELVQGYKRLQNEF
ncbi:MAG: hypothetical protein U0989_11480 [Azonexus sp.]|nr:hypothetical protein [Azonexus sp.]MDZ4315369.1 hypothetical protein [Azonexus sp.]